jgi:hypothetical protein
MSEAPTMTRGRNAGDLIARARVVNAGDSLAWRSPMPATADGGSFSIWL